MSSIGSRLRQKRIELGLTQKTVAAAAGVSKAAISKWETNGGKAMSAVAALRISRAINVNPFWLIFGEVGASDDMGHHNPASDIHQTAIQIAHLPATLRQAVNDLIRAIFTSNGSPWPSPVTHE